MTKVVRFTASWCGPCKVLAPIFNELAADFASRATFETIDIDEDPELSKLGKRSDFAAGMGKDVERSKIEDEIRRMGTDWRGQDSDFRYNDSRSENW